MRQLSAVLILGFLPIISVGAEPDVASLIAALQGKDVRQSIEAAYKLGKLGVKAKAAIPALVAALEDTRTEPVPFILFDVPSVATAAADALVMIGESATAEVEPYLSKNDRYVRLRAIRILAVIDQNRAKTKNRMRELALDDDEPLVRYSALQAYAALERDDKQKIVVLAKAAKDANASHRANAAQLLGECKMAAEDAVKLLTMLLNDSESYHYAVTPDFAMERSVRCDVADALGEIGTAAKPTVAQLSRLMKSDDDPEVRVASAVAIGRITDDAKSVLPVLVKEFADDKQDTRGPSAAAQGLAKFGAKARVAIPELAKALRHESLSLRLDVVNAIATIGGKESIPFLMEAVNDNASYIQQKALIGLGRMGATASAAVRLLESLSEDADLDQDVRRAAAEAIFKIRTDSR